MLLLYPKVALRSVYVAPAVVALLAAGLIFAQTNDYSLLGFDSYPIIITSRVQSPDDLLGNFSEKLMDGRYAGDFYRPLLNLTFAADYAIWGLNAVGYHLTNALLFGGCAAGVFALVRRLTGPGVFAAPVAAMLFFVLHPASFEVVPVPPRRPEPLCGLFMALALASQLSPKALKSKWPAILPALFGLLAVASKETGLLVPAFALPLVLMYSPRAGLVKRIVHAATALIPHLVAVGIMLAARFAVIGGMGGHRTTGLNDALARFPRALWGVLTLLVAPQPLMRKTPAAGWLALGVLLGMIATAAFMFATRRTRKSDGVGGARLGQALVFAIVWLALLSATYATAGRIEPWYLLMPAIGLATLVGVGAGTSVNALRYGPTSARITAGATAALLLALIGWQARYSPFVHHYDEYERATAVSEEFLRDLHAAIDGAPDGTGVWAPDVPRWVPARANRPTMFGAAILSDYSIQAWVELTYPDRRIRVATGNPNTIRPPDPDELVIGLRRLRRGYESAAARGGQR